MITVSPDVIIGGYIVLARKIIDNPIFDKPEMLKLYVYCLARANYSDTDIFFNNQTMTIKKGSFVSGRKQLARDLKENESTTYKRIGYLKKCGYLDVKSNNKFSIITVTNYEFYQEVKNYSNSKVTTKEHQSNTDKTNKEKERKEYNPPTPLNEKTPSSFLGEIQTLFNQTCPSLPKCKQLTQKRITALKARIKDNKDAEKLEFWTQFFNRVENSDFLTGRKTDWQANFDWIIKSENFIKILEGNYDNKPQLFKRTWYPNNQVENTSNIDVDDYQQNSLFASNEVSKLDAEIQAEIEAEKRQKEQNEDEFST